MLKHILTLISLILVSGCSQNSPDSVNRQVNTSIQYRSDPAGQDIWQSPQRTLYLGTGDCEDYALLKQHLLAGYPSRLLYVTSQGEWHVILEVLHRGNKLYLDNKFGHVLSETEKTLIYGPGKYGLSKLIP